MRSKHLTASGVVTAEPATIYAICLTADSNDSAMRVYNHASSASGEIVGSLRVDFDTTPTVVVPIPKQGLKCDTGIYVELVAGTTPDMIVYYE